MDVEMKCKGLLFAALILLRAGGAFGMGFIEEMTEKDPVGSLEKKIIILVFLVGGGAFFWWIKKRIEGRQKNWSRRRYIRRRRH